MKTLYIILACVCLTFSAVGCAEGVYYGDPSVSPTISCVEFVDDYGARTVCAPHYYVGNDLVYWDAHFGVWIGPRSYWREGRWYSGSVYGYHGYYHRGAYHGFYGGGGAWHSNGYRGGSHGGGHGGHR